MHIASKKADSFQDNIKLREMLTGLFTRVEVLGRAGV
jgi:hypothetical protein